MNATEIVKNLWLGDILASQDIEFLKRNNIKNIISVIPIHLTRPISGINYLNIPMVDRDMCGIDLRCLHKIFESCNNFIRGSLQRNEGILIHCKRGHNRSAIIVTAFLTKYFGIGWQDAIRYINLKRPNAPSRYGCMMDGLKRYATF